MNNIKVFYLLFFLFLFFYSTPLFSQWIQHLPSPYGEQLLDVCTFGENEVFISAFGPMIKSSNAGEDWTLHKITNQNIRTLWYSVFFINSSTGWMSTNGLIVKTTDGGVSWTEQNPNTPDQVYKIQFFDEQNGIAITGQEKRVLTTTNGGNDWVVKSVSSTNFLQCGYFVDSQTGWVAGQNEILKTIDAGTTWSNYPITSWFFECYFVNDSIGWFTGSGGQISKTTDAGLTWNNQNSNSTRELYSIYMFDENLGWVSGRDGIVLKTEDGGSHWNTIQTPTNASINAINFSDQHNGWAVGDSGVVLRTTDGGENWLLKSKNLNSSLSNGFFTDSNNGWLAGNNGRLFNTSDGGINWAVKTTSISNRLNDVFFINSTYGWTAGEGGNIATTSNGGTTWNMQSSGLTNSLKSICFLNESTGFIVGFNGALLKTSDAGSIWTNDTMPASNQFIKTVHNNNEIWVCGYNNFLKSSLLLKSDNYGLTWTNKFLMDSIALHALYIKDNLIFVGGGKIQQSGQEMVLFRSSDNGETWEQIISLPGLYNGNYFIDFIVNNQGDYIALTTSKIYYSSNQGIDWQSEEFPMAFLNAIFTSDSNTYWVTGQNSLLLKNSNSGITSIKLTEILINNFSLSQNYPNPFNPSTKISYSVAGLSKVILKVYDIIGREIITLVNEEKPAGKYEVNFNASSLASGVYFYQIKAGDFVQTKKLILLK